MVSEIAVYVFPLGSLDCLRLRWPLLLCEISGYSSINVLNPNIIGIVDGTMGILSRKMAMPAQLPANPIHYKEVLNPKAVIDPKK